MSYVLHDGVNYYKAPYLLPPSGATGGVPVPVPSAIGRGLSPIAARGPSGYYGYLECVQGVCTSGGSTTGSMLLRLCSPTASATMSILFHRQVFPVIPTLGDRFTLDFAHPMRCPLPGQTTGAAFEVTLENDVGAWFLTVNGFLSYA